MTTNPPAADRPVRPAWVPDELYPFESHYADVAGSRVHYIDEGGGPPLLLLHGNPTWSFLYREIVKGLRDRYRCNRRRPPRLRPVLAGTGLRLHAG